MILYVNGDSHAAAAEAVVPHSWACDDQQYHDLGRKPHPDNQAVSYGVCLSRWLDCSVYVDAQAGCSNTRIIRTTQQWINDNYWQRHQCFLLLQWSTWERQEWWHQGQDYQVNASGLDTVPEVLQQRYRQFVVDIDWQKCQQHAHKEIWEFHCQLKQQGIRHLMFNGNSYFEGIDTQQDWGTSYIGPYDGTKTFDFVLKNNGFETVSPKSWHFGEAAHCFWSQYLLKYITSHNLLR